MRLCYENEIVQDVKCYEALPRIQEGLYCMR